MHSDIDHLGDPMLSLADLAALAHTGEGNVRGVAPAVLNSGHGGWQRLVLRVSGVESVEISDPDRIAAGWLIAEDLVRSAGMVSLSGVYPIDAVLHGTHVGIEFLISADEGVYSATDVRDILHQAELEDGGSAETVRWRAGEVQTAGDVLVAALDVPPSREQFVLFVRDERFFWVQGSLDGRTVSVRVDGALGQASLIAALGAVTERDPEPGEISATYGRAETMDRSMKPAVNEVASALRARRFSIRAAIRRATRALNDEPR
ncbi:hypothetical protein D9V32_05690 [Mycetocola tolaasinivorans]|uniref:Uncharacterized protein n=1 Tax=Mycetocola tolaasinivorans TaxID=76635 RepID=A0A3L7AAK4_9MICO|nr:hypothetical protein D9V32_05690 [Mycetocola tolaasinivorans]